MAGNKKTCTCCGKSKASNVGFYLSHSNLYRANDGRMAICKDCLFERYKELLLKYEDDEIKAIYHLCMNLDVYFNKELVESSFKQEGRSNKPESLLKVYLTKVNSLMQYKGMNSIGSDFVVLDKAAIAYLEDKYKNKQNEETENKENDIKEEKIINDEIRKKWWREYSDEECLLLEEYYEYYFNNYDHEKDPAKLDRLKEICTFKLIIAQAKKARPIDTKIIKDFSTLVSQTLTDANLKPSQRKAYGDQAGEGLGTDIRSLIENKEPVSEVLPQFKDVDNLSRMIERTFLNPFKKVYGLHSESKGEENDN